MKNLTFLLSMLASFFLCAGLATGLFSAGDHPMGPSTTTTLPNSCLDPDAGDRMPEYVRGEVSGVLNGHSYVIRDGCNAYGYAREWSCDGTGAVLSVIACLYGCANGACINGTITTTTSTPPVTTMSFCADSDGLDAYTLGNTSGWVGMPAGDSNQTDYCVNDSTVYEQFCRYNGWTIADGQAIDCGTDDFCYDGACAPGRVLGDYNLDGHTGYFDLVILASSYGKEERDNGFDARADSNGDGAVDYADLLALATHYGR